MLAPLKRARGRPHMYPDQLFLKALVIMMVRRLHKVNEFLAVLAEPTPEMHRLRGLLTDPQGRFPSRRPWERRLAAIPATLPAPIGCLGRHLVDLLQPWHDCARAAAIDSTGLRALGGVGHKQDREAGVVPHTSIDTEAHWTKSGWHGWVYGWKLHLVCTAARVWSPLAADLTPANAADHLPAPALLAEWPLALRFLLGDQHYGDPALHHVCARSGCVLITPTGGRDPHTDDGVEVRRLLHKTRSIAIENFNEQFKGSFEGHGQVPTRGLVATRRLALGAIFVYQLTLLHRHHVGADLRVGLKAFIRAA
jgi:Transposase DDE domain